MVINIIQKKREDIGESGRLILSSQKRGNMVWVGKRTPFTRSKI